MTEYRDPHSGPDVTFHDDEPTEDQILRFALWRFMSTGRSPKRIALPTYRFHVVARRMNARVTSEGKIDGIDMMTLNGPMRVTCDAHLPGDRGRFEL